MPAGSMMLPQSGTGMRVMQKIGAILYLDCSSFVQYCYWAQNLPFSAGSTAAYRNAADLVSISPSEVQPGDLRVVYASGGEQGHVQMALGGGAWIECCYGYGVAVNMSNAWMESRPCYYFRYAGF